MESFEGLGQGKSLYGGQRHYWPARNSPEINSPTKIPIILKEDGGKTPGKGLKGKK